MTYLAGMLWLDDDEVFNNGRTLANMVAARAAGTLPPNFHFLDEEDCDCAAYNLIPTQETGPFTTLLACLPACFDADNLNQTLADNPWYDVDDFASSEFLGVWVYAVTGLDGRHNARTTTPRGAFPRGSILSPLTPTHRTITYDIALVATSTCGLDYGMQWLEQQLASAACAGCDLQTMTVRSCCPPDDDPEYGIWQFKEVGLGEGPEWLSRSTRGWRSMCAMDTSASSPGTRAGSRSRSNVSAGPRCGSADRSSTTPRRRCSRAAPSRRKPRRTAALRSSPWNRTSTDAASRSSSSR
jgi:hypothetical protein